jgi:mRNA interferase MazF
MGQKDFQRWHALKSRVDTNRAPPFFREQEIWWCSIGVNVGAEQDGKNELFERPVLIFRKFNRELFFGLPLMSNQKIGKHYHIFPLHGQQRTVVLSQLRLFSGKRLTRRIGKLSDQRFTELDHAFMVLINETDPLRGPRVPNGNCPPTIPP